MVVRRCPKCGTASDDVYGFCIKCGFEFPKLEVTKDTCPLCGFQNPEEADYCVKCGTPLIFKQQMKKDAQGEIKPIIIKATPNAPTPETAPRGKYSTLIITLGYIFSILGGIIGLIIAIYLSTRKNPRERRHGHIQLAIFAFYVILIAIFYFTGNIPADAFTNYTQMMAGNMKLP